MNFALDNDVFRLNGPNIEITKEFDRENGPTYFENRIICTVENLEGLTLLRVHQNISVRVKDVDDNPPQPQDKIAIQVKSRNLTKVRNYPGLNNRASLENVQDV